MSFFKASTKEEYSLRLAVSLAESFYGKQPVTLAQVSREQDISQKYLEELILPFKKQKLVKAISGRGGGYVWLKDPRKVTARDIIWMVDKTPALTLCTTHGKRCPHEKQCKVKTVWSRVQVQMEETLGRITLATLIK